VAEVSRTKALTNYFNSGDGKRDTKTWMGELRALSDQEKDELARGVAAVTGDTLPEK
jgi:hypothetical protein